MRFPRDATVAGHPIAVVKEALRRMGHSTTRESFAARAEERARRQRVPREVRHKAGQEAVALWDALLADGLLVAHPDHPKDSGVFQTTEHALSIANATIGAGYRSDAADEALAGFVQRCHALEEADSIYPYRVGMAILFGSHAAGKDRVGDVDLWVHLVPRHKDHGAQEAAKEHFIEVMQECGFTVPGGLGDIFWPHQKTLTFLKNRSRILSFASDDEQHLQLALKGPCRVVHPPDGQKWLDEARQRVGKGMSSRLSSAADSSP